MKTPLERMKYDPETECWNWIGALAGKEYGITFWNGKRIYVHRLAAVLWKGFKPESGLHVLHHCDNPRCFNPKHLFVGTGAEAVKWRMLNIDWYERGLLRNEAWRIVREVYGPMIPLRLYYMLEAQQYKTVIRGFTVQP